jgi:hypothetical protein
MPSDGCGSLHLVGCRRLSIINEDAVRWAAKFYVKIHACSRVSPSAQKNHYFRFH